MHRLSVFVLLLSAAVRADTPATVVAPGLATSVSYTGNFSQDTDQREVFFTLLAPGNVLLRTFSYAGGLNGAGTTIPQGGFDPTLSLFDSTGRLVSSNQDGGCGLVAADAVTGMCWDSYLIAALPAGSYRVVLTQSTNVANGPTLLDGFNSSCSASYQSAGLCTQNFTPDPDPGVLPAGFWDETRDQRTAFYALDVSGVATAVMPSFTNAPVLPGGVVGQVYPAFTFSVQPTGTYTWSIAGGTLPPGLTLDPNTGVLSGTITAAGTYTFTVQATDGVQSIQQTVTLTVSTATPPPNALTVLTTTLPGGRVGQNYGPLTVTGGGGSGSYSWSAANLPPGLTISASGQITGTPTAAGIFSSVILTIEDVQGGASANSGFLTLTVLSSILTVSSSGTTGEIALGSTVSTLFQVTGGTAPYTWSSTNLPSGLTLNSATGALTGTPLQPGSYTFTITATDSQTPKNTVNYPFTLQVFGLATPSTFPNAIAGSPYSLNLTVAGGKAPYKFSSQNLPPGLSLVGSLLSGTVTTAGTYSFNVQVTDANGVVSISPETLVVTAPGALTLSGGALPGGTVSMAYSQSLASTGGAGPLKWTLAAGALPGGLSLGTNGAITGTPDKAGTFAFTAQVTDSTGAAASAAFTIVIASQPLLIYGLTVPTGMVGSDYPPQILTGTGGTGPYTFTFTGTLPPGLTFANGQLSGIPTATGTFSISVTITDSGSPPLTVTSQMQIVVNLSTTDLILSDVSISFGLTQAASGLPTPQNVTVRSSNVQQLLNYSVAATPAVAWLDVTGAGTTTPGSISFALDPSATTLPASATPLTTAVVVTCLTPSPCAGNAQTINISLLVTSPSPQLQFTSGLIEFNTTASATATISQTVGLQNIGGGSALITSVTPADNWLTVSGVPSAIAGGPASLLTFTVNPTGLGAGFFRTIVIANSPAGSVSIPVTFSVTQAQTLLLSTQGDQRQSMIGSSPGNNQGSFQVSTGGGVSWTATVLSGGSWLSINGGGGSTVSQASPSNSQTVSYTIDRSGAAALSPAGIYFGTIQITAVGAPNSPQIFEVALNVAPAGSPAIPDPEPSGLIFTSVAGSGAPASQSVSVYSSSATAIPYSASAATLGSGAWLSLTPSVGTSSASNPAVSTVSVTPGTLTPGIYQGAVSYQFSAAAVRTVNVMMIIQAAGSACTPKRLVPTFTGLDTNFAAPVALPTPISVTVLQDCGVALGSAQVMASFSNGDAPLALNLVDASSGLYSGTWTPGSASPQVTVAAAASASGFNAAIAQVTGQTSANTIPLLTPGGAVHIYNPLLGAAVAPGTIVSIFGSNLAPQAIANTAASLPLSLGNTSVTIGGILAALYYVSPTQINVEVPVELVSGDQYEVIVNSNGTLSTAESLQVTAASPGIAALPNGQIIAQHLDYSLVSTASPAKPGEYIVFYLAGLGLTDTPVADGAPSPSNPLAHPLIAPALTLNGSSAPIAFVGLTPGFVGLFQMNFQVPAGTPNGNLALTVSQSGVASNSTILPVHN